jgi:hypothetical protein
MFKKIFISLLILGICLLIKDFHTKLGISNSTGAPPGYSGSPADGYNCSVCHAHMDSVVDTVNWISTDIPPQGYYHSGFYNITLNIPEQGFKGFEISVQDAFGNQSGSLIAGGNTQIVGSGKYITHTAPGISNPQTWSFQWFPGNGNVTIYGAFTVDTNKTYIQAITVEEEPCTHCHSGIDSFYYDSKKFYSFFTGTAVRVFRNSYSDENINLFIYSINGELIKSSENIFPQKGMNYFDIDTGNINDGIYIIVLRCDDFTSSFKIFISK